MSAQAPLEREPPQLPLSNFPVSRHERNMDLCAILLQTVDVRRLAGH